MKRREGNTLDLFAWQPPPPVKEFPQEKVRAAELDAMCAKGMALSMKESGKAREQIAIEMGDFLNVAISKDVLDKYVSEASKDHSITLVRFIGLLHSTRDIRLLQMIAKFFGWAVVPEKFLPAIEEAMLTDKIEELQQRKTMARRTWKGA